MTDQLTQTGGPPGGGPGGPNRTPGATPPWYVGAVATILVLITALLVILVARDDGDTEVQTVLPSTTATSTSTTATTEGVATTATVDPTGSTSTTGASTTTGASSTTDTSTTASTTATSSSTSTTAATPEAPIEAVWPATGATVRYIEPVAAATDFATDYLGFDDPVIGPFLEGDGRSGEVEIRPDQDGPGTTVFVRQLTEADTWWVIGAATTAIELTAPDVLDEIASPLQLTGRAMAFEGVVDVELRADGVSTPLVTGIVVGGGTEMADFEGSFPFDWPDRPAGAVVLTVSSPEDGSVVEATVVRIRFPLAG